MNAISLLAFISVLSCPPCVQPVQEMGLQLRVPGQAIQALFEDYLVCQRYKPINRYKVLQHLYSAEEDGDNDDNVSQQKGVCVCGGKVKVPLENLRVERRQICIYECDTMPGQKKTRRSYSFQFISRVTQLLRKLLLVSTTFIFRDFLFIWLVRTTECYANVQLYSIYFCLVWSSWTIQIYVCMYVCRCLSNICIYRLIRLMIT